MKETIAAYILLFNITDSLSVIKTPHCRKKSSRSDKINRNSNTAALNIRINFKIFYVFLRCIFKINCLPDTCCSCIITIMAFNFSLLLTTGYKRIFNIILAENKYFIFAVSKNLLYQTEKRYIRPYVCRQALN